MTLPPAPRARVEAGSARRAGAGRRVLLLDPIGRALGSHDRALAGALVREGCEVLLGAEAADPPAEAAAGYRSFVPYRGIYGDGNRLGKLLSYGRACAGILREVRAFRPDAVVLYYVLRPYLDLILVRRLRRLGIPVIVCAHDVLPLDTDRDRMGWFGRLYRAAAGVHVFGRFAREKLVGRLGYPQARVSLAHLGMDHVGEAEPRAAERARDELGVPAGVQMVLCLGIIKPTKGVEDLLRAFAALAERHPRARLWIVGRPRRVRVRRYARLARRLGVEGRTVFRLGHLSEREFTAWLQAADVVVHPDTRLYQSGVIQQASALARPIVATAVGAVPEVLEHGVSAWLVPAGDPRALTRAIAEALDDPVEAARRGREARRTADRCPWSAVAQGLVALIETAVRAEGSRPEAAP